MRARGFVFSLDAFVAFVLIMITINLLIFTIGAPKPYYTELEAAHILAHDTLSVLATSGDAVQEGGTGQTYLERILTQDGATGSIMRKVAGGEIGRAYNPIIPKGYGYRLEYLNLDSAQAVETAGTGGVPQGNEDWQTLYDAGADCPSSDRCGKNFTKLQASAITFLSAYIFPPMPGKSPFCHAGCNGYGLSGNAEAIYAAPCDATPCNTTTSNFRIGKNAVRIVRLIVYT